MRRAIIMAGGQGARLRPYTAVLPKPLLPLGDRPVLDIVIRQLRSFGFGRITIATGYLADLIEAFFRGGSAYGVTIDYVREPEPLGTIGALALIPELDEPFLVMNGDVLTDLDYAAFLERHVDSGAVASIATIERVVEVSLGVMQFEDAQAPTRVTGYVEKPSHTYEASMGVYCFDPRVLDWIEPGARLDFPDLVLRLLADGERVEAWRPDAYWLDFGRHDDYELALNEFESIRARLLRD